jgi:hypothetical protein
MRRRRSWILCLLALSGCASGPGRSFRALDNCEPKTDPVGAFRCVNTAKDTYVLPWTDAQGLICFKLDQFKAFNEACHAK